MKFEIGEIAIIKNSYYGLDGMETKITKDLSVKCTQLHPDGELMYGHIVHGEGVVRYALPSQLRKKKPPKEIDWVKMCNLKVLEAV